MSDRVTAQMPALSQIEGTLEHGNGILRLAPTWVPRAFCVPGRRLRLHPDDYFAFGGDRGGIDERWLASAVRADNGAQTGPDEGLSFVVAPDGELLPFDVVVEALGGALIGERLFSRYGTWPMYSKFFDNRNRLPFHVHHRAEHAALVRAAGKPEAYYFPPQMNNHPGDEPLTHFGLQPHITQEQLRERLTRFGSGDNQIISLSQAISVRLGTGWDVPAGLAHAPSSLCTYEPQAASDVYAMLEPWTGSQSIPEALLWKDVPDDHRGDYDFLVDLLDWRLNTDPQLARARFMAPIEVSGDEGTSERWVVYRSEAFSAKELTIAPGATAQVTDGAAYGCIAVQGFGTFGTWPIQTATLIRYGALTYDEYFVAESAARAGVHIANHSLSEPLVLLQHFGPGNPDNIFSNPD